MKNYIPLCFSCEKRAQKYITGLCQFCSDIANTESPEELGLAIIAERNDSEKLKNQI